MIRRPALAGIALTLLMLTGCPQPSSLTIEPESLTTAVEGQHYEVNLGIGTDARQRWSVIAGALPAGVTLEERSGVLSGTPTQNGDFEFTVQALDLSGLGTRSGERTYQLHVIPQLKFSGSLSSARVNEPYNQKIPITGGVEPYLITVIGLPAGLTFDDATDTISGTPLLANTGQRLDITVHDSGTPQQAVALITELVIKAAPVNITTTQLPAGRVNRAYTAQLQAADGLPPYTWGFLTTAPGTLPAGLSLNPATGAITGTPTAQGTSTFTIRVTDSETPPNSDSQELSIVVGP